MRARENPFRTQRLQSLRFRSGGRGSESLWCELEAMAFRGAIVGPHGSGKTTLLRELRLLFEERGFRTIEWFIAEDRPRPSLSALLGRAIRLGPGEVLLFDGAGHLGRFGWRGLRQATRRAGGVVVTSHSRGLLPTWVETSTDPQLLEGLVRELLADGFECDAAMLERLYAERQGNLREVFLSLYDLAARRDASIRSRSPSNGG